MSDPWQEPSVVAWTKQVLDDMLPKLQGSAVAISLCPEGEGDVKFWVELGAMIMLDKPIVVVAMGEQQIPEKLRRVADEIVRLPEGVSPEGADELREALWRLMP